MVAVDKLDFIIKQNEKNKLSHAFLIETNNLSMCLDDVKEIIKIINKGSNENIDKLIESNSLPSLCIIEPEGMSIKKNQMEELENKFSTKPIYSKYNNYVIYNADKMNESASNAILKFLEEPEDNIIGFFIVNNKENLLPTIRSRCEIVHVDYQENIEDDREMLEIIDEYLNEIENGNNYLVNKEIILSKYTERVDIEKIFNTIFYYYLFIY